MTATFDASAQFPKDVEFNVRELDSQSEEYRTHYEKTKEKLGVKNLYMPDSLIFIFHHRAKRSSLLPL